MIVQINFLGEQFYSIVQDLSNASFDAQFLVLSKKLWLSEKLSFL